MTPSPDDRWLAGDAYEAYMGRWSRRVAAEFVDWLGRAPSSNWLDVGCGTGALTSAILARADPASVTACDPAVPFVEHSRKAITDARASFVVAGTDALPGRVGGFDQVVSGLVLNFVPNPGAAVAAMRGVVRPGGIVAAYVWDYGEGMEFLRHFWDAAVELDAKAAALDEGRRFPLCEPTALAALFRASRLEGVESTAIEIATDFASFADYWAPFLGNTGPAPSYVASLDSRHRDRLRDALRKRLRPEPDGSIRTRSRVWAVRGTAD
jgi:SAM-dependent methyltransferase